MKHTRFYLTCGIYIALASVVVIIECARSKSKGPVGRTVNAKEEFNCAKETYKQHSEEFVMTMGLCRKNISVVCATKPSHPCLKNRTLFKATAVQKGYTGQCLIEAELSKKRTLRFYIEAKRVRNPNEEGSRSLGGDKKEEHQRGKCLLKYVCHERVLRSINMDCGTVLLNEKGRLSNFTRRRLYWAAPPKYRGMVLFTTAIQLNSNKLTVDLSANKLSAPGIPQKVREVDEDEEEEEEAAQEYTPIKTIRSRNNKKLDNNKNKPVKKKAQVPTVYSDSDEN